MNPLLKLSFFITILTLSYQQTTDYDCYAFAIQWMSKHTNSFIAPLLHRQLLR